MRSVFIENKRMATVPQTSQPDKKVQDTKDECKNKSPEK